MTRVPVRRAVWLLPLSTTLALVCALAAFGATMRTSAAATLVVDNSFTIKTSDPQRAFDPTASIIDRAIYDTLFTYNKGDLTTRSRCSCSRGRRSNGAKTFTFQLKKNVHFANGTPLTSADVVFSLNRLINIKGNPASLLAGITVSAHGKYTVVMKSGTPATQLTAILANPSTGIVNSKLVKAHGGTAAADAANADKAEQFLNSSRVDRRRQRPVHAEGLQHDVADHACPEQEVLGPEEAGFANVVVRNMIAPTQLINVQRGSHEVAIDLSSDQAQTLKGNSNLNVSLQPSTWIFWLFANNDSSVLVDHVEQAVPDGGPLRARLQVDRVGRRARRDPGARDHPVDVPRRAAADGRDQAELTKAKASLAASGVGSTAGDARVPE